MRLRLLFRLLPLYTWVGRQVMLLRLAPYYPVILPLELAGGVLLWLIYRDLR